jgi:hypothetical protein
LEAVVAAQDIAAEELDMPDMLDILAVAALVVSGVVDKPLVDNFAAVVDNSLVVDILVVAFVHLICS